MSEELATQEAAGLPAQRYNPGTQEITAEDIPVPRVKFGQGLSRAVLDGDVAFGAIYAVIGQNDSSPTVLAPAGKGSGGLSDPVRFYVLQGPRKGFSFKNTAGDLDNSREIDPATGQAVYPDLSLVKNNDPTEVYRTFDYVIAVADPEPRLALPHKLMLYRKWGADAAKRINLELMMAQMAQQDTTSVPFTLRARKDENDQGQFATAIIDVAEVTPEQAKQDAELVARLRQFTQPTAAQQPTSSAPAIEAPALD